MKFGLDIHGVIDKYPKYFSRLSLKLLANGHEVHIVTGQGWDDASPKMQEYNIVYSHHFSIIDHHREIGTKMWDNDSRGKGWWMDKEDWAPSKGLYAKETHLDVHFDDSLEYAEHFPDFCTFILVPPVGFDECLDML